MLSHCISTASPLHPHCISTASPPHLRRASTASVLHLHRISTASLLHLHCILITIALHIHCISIASLLHLHCIPTASPLHLHCIFTAPPLHPHCISPHRHYLLWLWRYCGYGATVAMALVRVRVRGCSNCGGVSHVVSQNAAPTKRPPSAHACLPYELVSRECKSARSLGRMSCSSGCRYTWTPSRWWGRSLSASHWSTTTNTSFELSRGVDRTSALGSDCHPECTVSWHLCRM